MGAALGAVAILGGAALERWRAGVAFGLAGVAYPTVLLLAPFVAVFLAFSVGIGRSVSGGGGRCDGSAGGRESSGLARVAAVSAWALGGVLVVAPAVALVAALAGVANLQRSWDYTISLARQLDQLGGTSKAGEVAVAFVSLLVDQWYIVAVAVVSLLVFRVRPGRGSWLLLLTPPALWLTATTGSLQPPAR